MILVEKSPESEESVEEAINRLADKKQRQGYKVGIICTDESLHKYPKGIVKSLGFRSREETIAHNLFAVLREFDGLNIDYIYSECFPKLHLGQAIMNRLSKAAGYHVIRTGENEE